MHATRDQIQKVERLGPQEAYAALRQSETRWVCESFVLQVLPKPETKIPYGLSVSVSKKAAKLAVTRNRIRRRLKAMALEIIPAQAETQKNYMLSARAKADEKTYEDLKKDLVWCLKRLSLLKA